MAKRHKAPRPRFRCPCCDYVTLSQRGHYDICPVCFWEDDGGDIDRADAHSGPNHMTLREGRDNFERFGACEERFTSRVVSEEDRARLVRRPRVLVDVPDGNDP